MLKLKVGYPTREEERQILDRMADDAAHAGVSAGRRARRDPRARAGSSTRSTSTTRSRTTSSTSCSRPATRRRTSSTWRRSSSTAPRRAPRIYLTLAAKAHAFLQGRGYVTPAGREGDRPRRAAPPRHRDLRGRGRGRSTPTRCVKRVFEAGAEDRRRRELVPGPSRVRDRPTSDGMLTREQLKAVRKIQIRTRHLVTDLFAGQYQSVFKGRGMEFAEVRQYQPGDDVRTIDWNVTARTGVPHVKRFAEERELTVMLLVDASASTRFGTRAAAEARARRRAGGAASPSRRSPTTTRSGWSSSPTASSCRCRRARATRHVLRVIREVLSLTARRAAAPTSPRALEHLEPRRPRGAASSSCLRLPRPRPAAARCASPPAATT